MLLKNTQKKIAALVVAGLLSVTSLSLISFAGKSGNIDGFSGERSLEEMFELGQSNSPFYSGDSASNSYTIEAVPGEEIRIPLTADMFSWSNGKNPLPMEALSVKDLTASKVEVRTVRQNGGLALDYVQLDTDVFAGKPFHPSGALYPMTGKTACISIMFAEEYKSVKDLDFEFDIYLIVDGKERSEDMKISLSGTMKNPEIELWSGVDYVSTADGSVAISADYHPGVKVDAGNGVTIDRLMLKNGKYYATSEVKHASDPGFDKDYPEVYPAVKMVYKLSTVNMRYGKSNVTIDTGDGVVYYVYNEKMEYIGMSNETLYYSDYYFMSTEEIPTFSPEEYLQTIRNLPADSPLGYDTGELAEDVYILAESNQEDLSQSKFNSSSEVSTNNEGIQVSGDVSEYETVIVKGNGADSVVLTRKNSDGEGA